MSFSVETQVHVRFADVDAMGHVNNAHYFTFFEQARVAYFKNFPDLDFSALSHVKGKSVILAEIRCVFRSPAIMDEMLLVRVRTRELRRSSFTMDYEIVESKTQRLVATGESAQVYYDYAANKSVEIPDSLRSNFENLEGKKFPKA